MKSYIAAAAILAVCSPAVAAPSWYYCDPSQAYYPYVKSCPVPWREVAPTAQLYDPVDAQRAPAPKASQSPVATSSQSQGRPEARLPPIAQQSQPPAMATLPVAPVLAVAPATTPLATESDLDTAAAFKIERAYLSGSYGPPDGITAYNECIIPKIQNGKYSSYDGGVSAVIVTVKCMYGAEALTDSCETKGGTTTAVKSPGCTNVPVLLSTAALKLMGR